MKLLIQSILLILLVNNIIAANQALQKKTHSNDSLKNNSEQVDWVNNNSYTLNLTKVNNYSDLSFLKKIMVDKKIVLLGENGHGVSEFTKLKSKIVKYLVEELGFSIVAFESGLFDTYLADKLITKNNRRDLLKKTVYDIWHTEEFLELFNFLGDQKNKAKKLKIAGIDVFNAYISKINSPLLFLSDVLKPIDTKNSDEVKKVADKVIQLQANPGELTKYFKTNEKQLIDLFEGLYESINRRYDELIKYKNVNDVLLAKQLCHSMLSAVKLNLVMSEKNFNSLFQERGIAMFNNIEFIINELYPDEKIIIWTHNNHVRLKNEVVENSMYPKVKSFGNYLQEKYGEKLYSIGFYMFEGEVARNKKSTYKIVDNEPGSLESILNHSANNISFYDISSAEKSPGSSWLFNKTNCLQEGINKISLVPKEQYDGLIFFKRVSLPKFLMN